jgi:hypothetical protein
MSDIQWWIQLFEGVFGSQIVKWILIILAPFGVLFIFLWLIKGIIEITKNTLLPLLYNENQKLRIRCRQQFADYIESEIRRLNQKEDWSDFRFAELEAEVEAEGNRRVSSILPFIKRTSKGLRREKSLSRALRQSQEKIIIVEGEPGSGKSVALRHVAYTLSQSAIKSKNINSLIPVYVNLKELKREHEQVIDKQFIENFVLKTLKRINDRDVDKFIDDEFQTGIKNGSWFFLFDSFDEIPEILSSADADSKIREYSEAIYDFLHGLNACRGVVASRYFKGPNQVGWVHFRVLSLTVLRQQELIQHSGLNATFEKLLLGNLEVANPEIKRFATNPLFLGLLINYAQTNEKFPQHSDIVFDTYINHRFTQDRDRVAQRFGVSVEEIREAAEKVAFCMSATQDLGLSPTRENIKKSLGENHIDINEKFDTYLDALEFMKLARSDSAGIIGDQRVFTFSHRRFQEYFPTKLILEKGNIKISELLTNPRWRETTVAICQTQPSEIIVPIIEVAWSLLTSYWDDIKTELQPIIDGDGQEIPIDFPWPHGCLHLLDLLQDGFANRKEILPESIRMCAGTLITIATLLGSLPHRIWALEVAGIAPNSDLIEIIRPAIADKGHFLSDVAYRQVASLDEMPNDIRVWIKNAILNKLLRLGIFRGSNVIFAQVSRLAKAKDYFAVIRGIQFGYLLDIVSAAIIAGALFISAFTSPLANKQDIGIMTFGATMMFLGIFVLFASLSISSHEIYFLNRLMVGGLSGIYLFFAISLSGFTPYPLILLFYASSIMPLLIIFVKEIPFEKGLVFVLFSPFFALPKMVRGFVKAIHSLKTFSPSKPSRRVLFIGLMFLIGFCALVHFSLKFLETETGGIIILTISTLFMFVMFYQVLTITYFRDRKYNKAWRKWRSEFRKEISTDEIIAVLPLISTRFAYKLIGEIRETDMLQPSQENLHFIKQLIRLVENPFLNNEFSEPLSVFLDDIGENKLKPMLLDELFQLVVKMESKLQ